jgi:protein-disulfide isomerase
VMSKAARTQARERLREERRREAERAKRRRMLTVAGIAVAVVAAIVVVGVIVQTQRNTVTAVVTPKNLSAEGGVAFGPAGGVPVITLYEDFQCPACKQFEQALGGTIHQLVAQGKVRAVYKPVAIIGEESEVAGSAAMCAADLGPEKFMRYSTTLFANQPPENSGQLTNGRLTDLGAKAGITDAGWKECVSGGKYVGWIKDSTEKASKAGLRGTPWVLLNGKELPSEASTPEGLRKAVELVSGRSGSSASSGTSPSPPSQ